MTNNITPRPVRKDDKVKLFVVEHMASAFVTVEGWVLEISSIGIMIECTSVAYGSGTLMMFPWQSVNRVQVVAQDGYDGRQ